MPVIFPIHYGPQNRDWSLSIPRQGWFSYMVACRVTTSVRLSSDELRQRKDAFVQQLQTWSNEAAKKTSSRDVYDDFPQLHPGGSVGIYVREGGNFTSAEASSNITSNSTYYIVVHNNAGPMRTQKLVQEILQQAPPGHLSFSDLLRIRDNDGRTLSYYDDECRVDCLRLAYLASVAFDVTIELTHVARTSEKLELSSLTSRQTSSLPVSRAPQSVQYVPVIPHAVPTLLLRTNYPTEDTFYWQSIPTAEATMRDSRLLVRESMSRGFVVLDAANALITHRTFLPAMTGTRGTFTVQSGENRVFSALPEPQRKKEDNFAMTNSTGEPIVPDYESFSQDLCPDLPLLFRLIPVAVIVRPDAQYQPEYSQAPHIQGVANAFSRIPAMQAHQNMYHMAAGRFETYQSPSFHHDGFQPEFGYPPANAVMAATTGMMSVSNNSIYPPPPSAPGVVPSSLSQQQSMPQAYMPHPASMYPPTQGPGYLYGQPPTAGYPGFEGQPQQPQQQFVAAVGAPGAAGAHPSSKNW